MWVERHPPLQLCPCIDPWQPPGTKPLPTDGPQEGSACPACCLRVRTLRYQSPLNSSGLIAMNNAIISPTTNPMIVPAASIFFSLVVIQPPKGIWKPHHILGQL